MAKTARHGEAIPPHMAYRPEIDGLRAIAVLAVVLYHFGVPGLNGGFVGVDVFFVISGFLIGGLLWKEQRETGRIRLGAFYMRRVRRLAPAFFAMATVSSVAAWFILLPFEFREFGKSLIAATVWLSNVQFWREAGYFDIGADSKVLLHTWSLSVEEQFYVFLPLFLVIFAFLKRALVGVLVALWALSLAACLWLTPSDPVAAFFLFPFRAWEMLTGVLLAIWMQNGDRPKAAWPSWLGFGLVMVSILFVRSEGFPGWQAMLPVAGTMLMLAGGDAATPVNRVLAMRGPVFVGLISYSLYLWHWPVLVLSGYWRGGYDGPLETAFWLAIAVVLAVLSWAFVERPLRRTKRVRGPVLLGGVVAAAVVMIGYGGLAFVRDGLPGRFDATVRGHIAASADFLQDWSRCYVPDDGPFAGVETCAIGPEGEPEVIIWGDSHLRALMDGLAAGAHDAQVPGLIIWHAGCPALFGVTKDETAATPAEDAACLTANEQLRRGFAQVPSVERILLVGRWAYYTEGAGTGGDAQNLISMAPTSADGLQGETQAEVFEAALDLTVAELNMHFDEVYALRQVPEVPFYSSRDFARALAHGRMTQEEAARLLTVPDDVLASRSGASELALYRQEELQGVTLIDPRPVLCPERCSVMQGDLPVYFDNNHLTNAGAMVLRPLFMPFLSGVPADG